VRAVHFISICARAEETQCIALCVEIEREGFLSKLQSTESARERRQDREALLIYRWERWPRSPARVCVCTQSRGVANQVAVLDLFYWTLSAAVV
jgi:hypothetical protein